LKSKLAKIEPIRSNIDLLSQARESFDQPETCRNPEAQASKKAENGLLFLEKALIFAPQFLKPFTNT
jgi:hypothetical protein